MKIEFKKQSYKRSYEHFGFCSGCNLLTSYGSRIVQCAIYKFHRPFCLPNYIFESCHNTSIFEI